MPTVDEDLAQIEKDTRTLKIEYEQYFAGGRKRPPADTQWRVESVIRRYSDRGAEMSYSQRFRYTNLAQTYAKYCEIWRKKLKEREEGTAPRHFGAAAREIEAERAKAAREQEKAQASAFVTSFSDPEREKQKIEKLYRKLIEARKSAGQTSGAPSFEEFGKFVRQKTSELKSKGKTGTVEYSVTIEGGRVKLKARVSA
ncbi:MAG TPA: MXAN_5187 C-terminal domain-containing protein [Candidatus Acidoferrales bacterium]|nr:MXAN_5187 C-terminal domain-containing protein [Candidatus Acidoferrales bacterium]